MKRLKFQADVFSWIKRAEEDKRWAKTTFKNGFYPQTCFIAQQIVEKALKAFLLANEKVPEKTHSLPKLVKSCLLLDNQFENLKRKTEILDKYYAPTRYPDINFTEVYTKNKAEEALNYATEVLEFVKSKINT